MSNPAEGRNPFAEHAKHFDQGQRAPECFYCNVAAAASDTVAGYRPGSTRVQLDAFGAMRVDQRLLVHVLMMINVEADRLNRLGVPLPDARKIVIDAAGRMIDRQRATAAGEGPLGPLVNVPVLNVPMREDIPREAYDRLRDAMREAAPADHLTACAVCGAALDDDNTDTSDAHKCAGPTGDGDADLAYAEASLRAEATAGHEAGKGKATPACPHGVPVGNRFRCVACELQDRTR